MKLVSFLLFLGCVATSATHARPTYSLTGLGEGVAWAINESGQVAGWSQAGLTSAFLYTPGSGRMDLGKAENSAYSLAYGLSNLGHVVGYSTFAGSGGERAFVYTPGLGRVEIPDSGTPRYANRGWGVNDHGDAVGASFLYSAGGQLIDLASLTGHSGFTAQDINNNGVMIGSGLRDLHAFVFTPGVGLTEVGSLGGNRSTAWAVNDSGQVVGSAETDRFIDHAFLYSPSSGIVDIGASFGEGVVSQAYGVNESGAVVGRFSPTGSGLRAFVYTSEDGAMDLNGLVNLSSADGWTLVSAQGITSDGRIAGWGSHNGAISAFVLTPVSAIPEPHISFSIALGLAGVAGIRRWSRLTARRRSSSR